MKNIKKSSKLASFAIGKFFFGNNYFEKAFYKLFYDWKNTIKIGLSLVCRSERCDTELYLTESQKKLIMPGTDHQKINWQFCVIFCEVPLETLRPISNPRRCCRIFIHQTFYSNNISRLQANTQVNWTKMIISRTLFSEACSKDTKYTLEHECLKFIVLI